MIKRKKMIRKYENKDIEKIIDIWLEASIKTHNFIDKKYWESKVDEMKYQYIPNSETYIYEKGENIIGFASLNGNRLEAIFIKPYFQGQGVGKELLNYVKRERKELMLSVYKENKKSISFYKRNGFKKLTEQEDKNTQHIEIIMEWKQIR